MRNTSVKLQTTQADCNTEKDDLKKVEGGEVDGVNERNVVFGMEHSLTNAGNVEEKKQREDMVDVLSSPIFRPTLLDARGEESVAVRRRMIRKLSHIFKPTHELESNGSPRRSYFDGTS